MRKSITYVLPLDEKEKQKLRICLLNEGKTITDGLIDQVNYIIDNNIPIEKPIEKFLNVRERLIEKYGTIKEAAKHTNVSYQTLMDAIKKIEKNKNYLPRKSTISMLSDLLEK